MLAMAAADAQATLTPPNTDLSLQIISRLFGDGWWRLISPDASPGNSVIFELLAGLNTVALAAVSVMIIYTVSVGVVGTAHEGEVLGKRYHSMWVPVRSVFSLGLLAPLPWAKGLSMIQALVLMFTYYGIGGADYLQNKTLDYLHSTAGQFVAPPASMDSYELATAVLKAEVAQQYYVRAEGYHLTGSGVYSISQSSDTLPVTTCLAGWDCQTTGSVTTDTYNLVFSVPWYYTDNMTGANYGTNLPVDALGRISLTCDRADVQYCQDRLRAFAGLAADLQTMAARLVAPTISNSGYLSKSPASAVQVTETSGATRDAVTKYSNALNTAYLADVTRTNPSLKAALDNFKSVSEAQGWLSLGSWYWTLGRLNDQVAAGANQQPFVESGLDTKSLAALGDGNDLAGELGVADRSLENIEAANPDAVENQAVAAARDTSSEATGAGILSRFFSKATFSIPLNFLVDHLTDGDPILSLQALGNGLMLILWGILGVWVTAKAIAAAAGKSVVGLLGAGAGSGALDGIGPVFWAGICSFFVLAFFFAYYLPSIPYITWILGCVAWFVLVFEAIVASTLWAAAHAIPEGDGLAGTYGRQGYMLFFSVLLRPSLMVIGFFGSVVLFQTFAWTIGETFKTFVEGLEGGQAAGIVALVAMLSIYVTLLVTIAHRIFGIVTWLPDNVLRWIGQQTQNLGIDSAESKTHAVVLAGARETVAAARPGLIGGPKSPGGGNAGGSSGGGGPSGGAPTTDNSQVMPGQVQAPSGLGTEMPK